MLFALEWIRSVRTNLFSAIGAMLAEPSLARISQLLTVNWIVILLAALIGSGLCFWGFRIQRHCHGLASAVLFAVLGWALGQVVPAARPSSPTFYAVSFFILGFLIFSMGYFCNVLAGCWLFCLALLCPVRGLLGTLYLWLAFIPAFFLCILYVRFKLAGSAAFGAVLLGLLCYSRAPWSFYVITAVLLPLGIIVQTLLQDRYFRKKREMLEAQMEKYPYGPGIAYGWKDPTLEKYVSRRKRHFASQEEKEN